MKPETRRIILTIREYENSIEMPDRQRLTYLDDNDFVHLKKGDVFASHYKHYADKCFQYLRFGDDIDLATSGALSRYDSLEVCQTPRLLLRAGLSEAPMLYTQRHLLEALHKKSPSNSHWHGLTIPQMKRLSALLERPAILCDSPTRKDTLIAVLPAIDNERLPLMVAIQPEGKSFYGGREVKTNMVLSVYGKYDLEKYLRDRITPERVIYINKEKSQELERLARLQLPGNYSNLDFNTILHRPQCLVNSPRSEPEKPKSLLERSRESKQVARELDQQGHYSELEVRRHHQIDLRDR